MSSLEGFSSPSEFLTSLFTMLNKCIVFEPSETIDWIKFTKKDLEIVAIPSMQDIPSVVANPSVIQALNKNIDEIHETYINVKEMYDEILEAELEAGHPIEEQPPFLLEGFSSPSDFLISLFTMLIRCKEELNPLYSADWIDYTKIYLNINTLPPMQNIRSVVSIPSVIRALNKNIDKIRDIYIDVKETYDEQLLKTDIDFLTSFFRMLIVCKAELVETYSAVWINYAKAYLKINTLPSIQNIHSVVVEPSVIRAFNENILVIRNIYTIVKEIYNKIITNKETQEQRKKNTITLRPSEHYMPLNTFNFGSTRQPNLFDQHFNKKSDSSMLLYLIMHGAFVSKTPKIMRGIQLNKFNVAAPGQCTFTSELEHRYIPYVVSDAVASGGIIDVPNIIREATAHSRAQINPKLDIQNLFEKTETNKDRIYNSELARHTSTALHSGKVGEEITYGNSFFEKKYDSDTERPYYGIFLCKKWDAIEGNILDNLLANPFFILFMNNKYDKAHLWGSSRNAGPIETKYFGSYKQLSTRNNASAGTFEVLDFIKTLVSSDLFEFCEEHRRPEISLIDNSCSVFMNSTFQPESNTSTRYDEMYDYFTHPKHANVAKGTRKGNGREGKGKRTQSGRKSKGKMTRSGRKSKGKMTRSGKKIKEKRF